MLHKHKDEFRFLRTHVKARCDDTFVSPGFGTAEPGGFWELTDLVTSRLHETIPCLKKTMWPIKGLGK